jgi:hypothetical protein
MFKYLYNDYIYNFSIYMKITMNKMHVLDQMLS